MSAKGLRAWQARAQALVLAAIVASTVSRMVAAVGSLPYVAMGAPTGVDGASHIAVVAETLMYRDSGVLPVAWRCLVNGCVLAGAYQGRALASVDEIWSAVYLGVCPR